MDRFDPKCLKRLGRKILHVRSHYHRGTRANSSRYYVPVFRIVCHRRNELLVAACPLLGEGEGTSHEFYATLCLLFRFAKFFANEISLHFGE